MWHVDSVLCQVSDIFCRFSTGPLQEEATAPDVGSLPEDSSIDDPCCCFADPLQEEGATATPVTGALLEEGSSIAALDGFCCFTPVH